VSIVVVVIIVVVVVVLLLVLLVLLLVVLFVVIVVVFFFVFVLVARGAHAAIVRRNLSARLMCRRCIGYVVFPGRARLRSLVVVRRRFSVRGRDAIHRLEKIRLRMKLR